MAMHLFCSVRAGEVRCANAGGNASMQATPIATPSRQTSGTPSASNRRSTSCLSRNIAEANWGTHDSHNPPTSRASQISQDVATSPAPEPATARCSPAANVHMEICSTLMQARSPALCLEPDCLSTQPNSRRNTRLKSDGFGGRRARTRLSSCPRRPESQHSGPSRARLHGCAAVARGAYCKTAAMWT